MPGRLPKVVMTLCVRDEEDILWENICFHREMGVAYFIITDNLSTDRTPEIIQRAVARNWAHHIREESNVFDQGKWVTRMARLAAIEHDADWVINNDADEFWIPESGSLAATLDAVASDLNTVVIPRHNFAGTLSAQPWFHRLTYRYIQSLNNAGRPLPPKTAHRAHPEIVVHQGNHGVSGFETSSRGNAAIEIFHFPVRSPPQFENTIRNAGSAYARNKELPLQLGYVKRQVYSDLLEHGHLNDYLARYLFAESDLAKLVQRGELVEDLRLFNKLNETLDRPQYQQKLAAP